MTPKQASKVSHFHLRHPDGDLLAEPYSTAVAARGAASIGGLRIGGYKSEGTEDKAYRVVSVGLRTMCPCKSSVAAPASAAEYPARPAGKKAGIGEARFRRPSRGTVERDTSATDSHSMRQNAGKKGGEPSDAVSPRNLQGLGMKHQAGADQTAPRLTDEEFAHLNFISEGSYRG